MARCRIVKPEFWDDEKLAAVSIQARLTYIGIWNFCDDYGVTKANSLWLKSRIFPFDERITVREFEKWIKELSEIKRLLTFKAKNETFFFLPNFSRHQVINRPSRTRYPEPPDNINDGSVSTHGALTDEIEIEVEVEREIENKRAHAREGERSVSDFDSFWSAYPKKVGKIEAKKAWGRANGTRPPTEQIVAKINQLKKSKQWTKDGGDYIPNPATWLNRGGWDDECKAEVASCKAPTWDDYEQRKP